MLVTGLGEGPRDSSFLTEGAWRRHPGYWIRRALAGGALLSVCMVLPPPLGGSLVILSGLAWSASALLPLACHASGQPISGGTGSALRERLPALLGLEIVLTSGLGLVLALLFPLSSGLDPELRGVLSIPALIAFVELWTQGAAAVLLLGEGPIESLTNQIRRTRDWLRAWVHWVLGGPRPARTGWRDFRCLVTVLTGGYLALLLASLPLSLFPVFSNDPSPLPFGPAFLGATLWGLVSDLVVARWFGHFLLVLAERRLDGEDLRLRIPGSPESVSECESAPPVALPGDENVAENECLPEDPGDPTGYSVPR